MRTPMRTRYSHRKEWVNELPEFDPTRTDYSETELELYADRMLRNVEQDQAAPVLFQEHIESRWRKEVNPNSGMVDETITNNTSPDGQRLFNRTHPQGRKVNSDQQRRTNGASYYR